MYTLIFKWLLINAKMFLIIKHYLLVVNIADYVFIYKISLCKPKWHCQPLYD